MFIQISHISKSFGGQDVLKDASFTLSDGEKVGLLGKNGSGKSTILKLLAGEELQDGGTISIQPKSLNIGYLPQTISDTDLDTLSSGQKTKKALNEILKTDPDILLLDEPTNHLDWEGLFWLESVVRAFKGPVLIISHDRYFLDNTVNKIIELDEGKIKVYGGNYSDYKQRKNIEQEAYLRTYKKQQKDIKKIHKEIVAKRQKAETSNKNMSPKRDNDKFAAFFFANRTARKFGKNIQSLSQRLDRIETIEKPKVDGTLRALFKPSIKSGQMVVGLKNVSRSFESKKVLVEVSLIVQKNQRIALIGSNGSGKTTIIKLIMQELKPDLGEIELGNNVRIGYLSQEHKELLNDRSVLDELTSERIDRTEAYKLLHRFLLPTEKINQQVRLLSSGEKSKLLLAKIMTKGANFIILDEPTNHLDISSREAIEESLANYEGTLLVVSHDRYFLDRIGVDRILFINSGKVLEK